VQSLPSRSDVNSSDVSSRTWPRPRGASGTKSSGLGLGLDDKVLGLGSQVLGLDLALEIKSLAIMPRTLINSDGTTYVHPSHFSAGGVSVQSRWTVHSPAPCQSHS